MAEYGVKYRFRWNDEGGGDWRIDICQAGYTGDILPRAIGASSVSLRRDRNGNICGTSLELTAECRVDEEFAELYTTDPFEFKVLVYAESVCIWTGYVTPELYSEPFIAPPYDVKVTASDNLGELKLTEWVGVGRLTFAQLLNTLLAQTGLSMGVKYISTLATGSISARAFFSTVTIDLDELSGKSYYDVLDQLLASFHAVLFQHGGSWVVLRETDVVPSISGGAVVPAGQSAGMPIRSLGSAYAGGLWPENHVDLTVEPAKKAISLVCPELWNRCGTASITNPSTGNATGTLTATFAAADGINLQDSAALSRYPLVLNIEALRKNRSNKVYYDIVVKVQGNGVTRYLVENTDAAAGYVWQSSSASIKITPGDKLYYAGRGDVSASKSGEVTSIPFPDCNDITALTKIEVTLTSNTIATSYRPTRYLPSVYFFGVWISYDDQFTSLMDTIAINNNARGAASDVNLIVSGLTDVALEKYFISNSLLDGSGSLLGAVHTSAFEGQDYISLLSRDYALSIAAPRLKAEGVFYGQERTDLPLFMSMGGLRYVIETWDWNLITGGVDFSALTLPAATITVTSETIVTGDNLGHGTSSGSGGSGGSSSSGAGYVAPGTGVPALTEAYIGTTRVQPSPTEDQDLTGIGNATLSGKLNLPQGAYLEVVNVGTTANPVYAIHTNIGLYSDSFVSAFGASDTGGGGGGIDLSAMWANLQVNESGTTGYNLQINPGHLTTALGTYVNAITTTGSGNAITAVSKDGSTLTFTKGSSFLPLSGGTLTGHLYLSSAQIYIKNSDTAILTGTTSTSSAAGTSMIGQARGTTTIRGFDDPIWRRYTNNGQYTNYTIYHSGNLTQSVVTGLIGSSTYAPYNADGYLPLSGGTMSGNIIMASGSVVAKFDVDTSRAKNGVAWTNTSDTVVGVIQMHNTTKSIYINATGASAIYNDAVGKYSLKIGENSLTYNTYNIWHAGNFTPGDYLPLAGGTMTGNITFAKSGATTVGFPILALSSITGGWERKLYDVRYDDTRMFHIGVFGSSSTFNYAYLGSNGYNGNNLRIYSDKVQFGDNVIWHAGNDGASSGLDADLLDGQHGSYYAAAASLGNYLPLAGGTMTGSPVLSNAVYLRANNAAGTEWTIMGLNSSDSLLIGYGTAGQGYETHLYGGSIEFHYGTARTVGMTLTSAGALVTTGNIILPNAVALQAYDTNGTAIGLINMGGANQLRVGYQSAGAGYDSFLHGNNVYLTYGTSRTTGLTLNSSGNVGIGTTSPANKLHVSGGGRFDSNANIWSTISGARIDFNKLSTYTTGYNQGIRFRIANSSNTEISSKYLLGVYSGSAYSYMYLGGTYSDATVRITDTGVGIKKGNASPSYTLDVTGTIHSTVGIFSDGYVSAFGVSSTSDARLKKDFLDTTLTVDDIAHAPAITFLWKDREGKRQAGSLAQYWETVLPEVVTDIEGKKGLDYGAAALVSAITIARDVNDHEKRIRELERENRELKRRLGYADR